jgi:hypothetical protein
LREPAVGPDGRIAKRLLEREVESLEHSVYLRVVGFGYIQKEPTEIWDDNASCIMMSKNLTNRDQSRHVDVMVHFLLDLLRDGHVKLVECAVLRIFLTL